MMSRVDRDEVFLEYTKSICPCAKPSWTGEVNVDPFGRHWTVATHVEDVAPDKMIHRMAKMTEGG